MSAKKDMRGQPFGRLVALYENGRSKSGKVLWHCKCECGRETDVTGGDLRSGHTKSCGCLNLEKIVERSTKHGITKSNPRLYVSIHKHFDLVRKDVSNYRNWTLDPRYSDNVEGVAMFCCDLISLHPEACAQYEIDKSLELDKDNNAENIFRPESIVFRPILENRSKQYNNLKLDDGTSLAVFCRRVGIETRGENGKGSKQYGRIQQMYRRDHKAHPELIHKANEYLTLLRRLKASLNLLADIREFAHGHKIHLEKTTADSSSGASCNPDC